MKKCLIVLFLLSTFTVVGQIDSTAVRLNILTDPITKLDKFKGQKIKIFLDDKEVVNPDAELIDLMSSPQLKLFYPKKEDGTPSSLEIRVSTKTQSN